MQVIVGCVVEDKDKFLMVQEGSEKRYGLWNYPGGHLEEDENIIEGAIRETFEETGYHVEISGVLPMQELFYNNEKFILIKFVGKVISFDENHELDGILQTQWMSSEEIFNLEEKQFRGYEANRCFLKNYLDNNIYPVSIFEK